MEKSRKGTWSTEEVELLKKLAPTASMNKLMSVLGRTRDSIVDKANYENIVIMSIARNWTTEEEEYLKDSWGQISMKAMSNHLGRSSSAIKKRAYKLGLGPAASNGDYISLSEFSVMSGIPKHRIIGILSRDYKFPVVKKTLTAKESRYYVDYDKALKWMKKHQDLWDASKVDGYLFAEESNWLYEKRKQDRKGFKQPDFVAKRWTKQEINKLKVFIDSGVDLDTIAKRLGKTKRQCELKISDMGWSYRLSKFFKMEELRFIKENYLTMTDAEIAEKLGRTAHGIMEHRLEMGLTKASPRFKWDNESETFLQENYIQMTDEELAAKLGTTVQSVKKKRQRLNISRL